MREKQIDIAFPKEAFRLDPQGEPLPCGMSLADFVLEQERYTLVVEVKDPSENDKAAERFCAVEGANPGEFARTKLVQSARDSYCWLHLMGRDEKPVTFVALIGLEKLGKHGRSMLPMLSQAVKRFALQECAQPWTRRYLHDSYVVDIDGWNRIFPQYPCRRIAP